MTAKRHDDGQIQRILEQARVIGNVRSVCRKHGISEQTFYRWRKRFPAFASDSEQLRLLQRENEELKKMVAEMALENRYLRRSTRRA